MDENQFTLPLSTLGISTGEFEGASSYFTTGRVKTVSSGGDNVESHQLLALRSGISPGEKPKVFQQSSFCWIQDEPPGRNQFVSFELKFKLDRPRPAEIHLFADTRYRLWVNETFLAYGPGRFVTCAPEYDSHDLSSLLKLGENLIRVEVNYYGTSSFQTMPDGCPGFIAAGEVGGSDVEFVTPGSWKARVHHAWDEQAPLFSFAQNPAEICNTRLLELELSEPAQRPIGPLNATAIPWLSLAPRSVPQPDYAVVRPSEITVAGPLDESLRWGMQFVSPRQMKLEDRNAKTHTQFTTWIHSPRDQTVALDCFWSDLALNGRRLMIDYSEQFGNHGQSHVKLHEGWNFLAGHFAHLLEHWAYLIGLPRESGASLHASPDLDCEFVFACSPPTINPVITPCPATQIAYVIPEEWILRSGSLQRITPARLVAWDRPLTPNEGDSIPFSLLSGVSSVTARAAIWTFDFRDEYYGHPVIEVEAPPGSILDVAYDDWKRADGCVNLYGSNPFTDAADRFILRGGRQRIEVLNPRGGIYLQLILRAPAESSQVPLRVHDVMVRRRTLLNTSLGSFECEDPVIDWAWKISVHTLQASTDEAYADCPWRERASYIGDSLVNFHLHRLISADLSVARRTFSNFGKAQLPNGQLACCAPSWLTRPHEDFTLIWIQAVRDIWAYTGDTAFILEQWPVIQRIWTSPTWKPDADGLWDTTGMHVFVDWGSLHSEREGAGNAIVNILRVAAAKACAEMAEALDLIDEAACFAGEADRISALLCDRLWNDVEGRFNASIGATTTAIHGNILALRYGVGPSKRILSYLEPHLVENFQRGIENGQFTGFAELYYFHYLLPALVAHDRIDLAEDLIQEHYGFIKELGYPTLPECFHSAGACGGSCCHSWSGAPAIHATEAILGLRLAYPGNPDVWRLDPKSSRHSRAAGTLPHPRGLVCVRWERNGERIEAQVTAPSGVTILPADHVDLMQA